MERIFNDFEKIIIFMNQSFELHLTLMTAQCTIN